MTDRDALLRVIMESPWDDTPRLVFADYLDDISEVGRAEFVRTSIERDRTEHAENCQRSKPYKFFAPSCTCRWGELDSIAGRHELSERRRVFNGVELDYAGDLTSRFARGFLNELHCSWADWLRHHAAIYWSLKQTVECPDCKGEKWRARGWNKHKDIRCGCGTGRIPRPFVPTAQPLETVRLTTAPFSRDQLSWESLIAIEGIGRAGQFNRVKCGVCDGSGWDAPVIRYVYGEPSSSQSRCQSCHGTTLNRWTCPEWPGLEFVMPASD